MRVVARLSIILLIGCTSPQPPPPPPATAPKPETVANLKDSHPPVDVKRFDALSWTTAGDGLDLFNHDTVKTGDHAAGRVLFHDGSQISIDEKSQVTIIDHKQNGQDSSSTVSLPQGSVTGEIQDGPGERVELTVRTNRGWVRVTNQDEDGKKIKARFTTSVSVDGETQVAVQSGRAVLVTKEAERPIASGESLRIAAGAVSGASRDTVAEDVPSVPEIHIVRLGPVKANPPLPKTAKTAVEKDEFKILEPSNRHQTDSDSIIVKGIMKGSLKAFLNGKPVVAAGGKFEAGVSLKPGLNLLVVQVVNTKTNAVTSHNLEVIRK